jgi:hypothetical protein
MPYFPLFNVENGGISENIYIFASSESQTVSFCSFTSICESPSGV